MLDSILTDIYSRNEIKRVQLWYNVRAKHGAQYSGVCNEATGRGRVPGYYRSYDLARDTIIKNSVQGKATQQKRFTVRRNHTLYRMQLVKTLSNHCSDYANYAPKKSFARSEKISETVSLHSNFMLVIASK